MGKWINIVGNKYGNLTVTSYIGSSIWNCLCICGNNHKVKTGLLKSGNTKSCGCKTGAFLNLSRTPEYVAWSDMKGRCLNENFKNYLHYGGRGIKVCVKWLESFENFYKDMGDRPKNCSLDRIDVDGDYSPKNCRWSDQHTQNSNKRNNKLLDFKGEIKPVVTWCKELNLYYSTVISRLNKHGWSTERTLTTPTNKPYIQKGK